MEEILMTLKKILGMGLIALAIVATTDCVTAATATPETIIVMPARKRVVHLAFQIARCKDVGLVTYNNSPTLSSPLIHVWNGQEWVQITSEDYQQGAFMSGEPRHVFILGDNNTLPSQMAVTPAWAQNAEKITSLETANLVNQFGKSLNFSSRQWKWIAEVNGLSITDQNADRRRYGRWGAPGKEVDLSPAKLDSVELPPGPIMTMEPKAIDVKPEIKPEAKAEATPEVNVETKVEAKPVVKPEAKPEVKVEAKVEAPKVEAVKIEAAKPAVTPKVEYTLEQKPATPPVPPVVEKPVVTEAAVPAAKPVDPTSK